MGRLADAMAAYLRSATGWARSGHREAVLDAVSTGPCPQCGEERIRVRDVRVDDLGYSVRVRRRWSCGCDDDGERPARREPDVVA